MKEFPHDRGNVGRSSVANYRKLSNQRGGGASALVATQAASGRAADFASDRLQFSEEDKMLMPIMILTSQLVIAVADNVPQFNIERGCRVDSASELDLNAGLSATIKRCVDDEHKAKDQLQTQWSGFDNSDLVMCTSETVGEKRDENSTPPSYVELLTCLQDQRLARKLPAK
jgi:hypothetical protein